MKLKVILIIFKASSLYSIKVLTNSLKTYISLLAVFPLKNDLLNNFKNLL